MTDLQNELQLSQIVNFPTHGNNTSDLILTDLNDFYNPPIPLAPFGRSTHLTVLWTPKSSLAPTHETTTAKYRPLTHLAILAFGKWLVHYLWVEVFTVPDVQTKWNNYLSSITAAYHHFFPEKKIRRHPADLPWITDKIKRLMQPRSHAHQTGNTNLYKSLRNKVIREIKLAKRNCYPDKLQHLKESDSSKWYGQIKQLCGLNNKSSTLPCLSHLTRQAAADEVSHHFVSICQRLPRLDVTNLPTTAPTIHEHQVCRKLQQCRTKRSATSIDIPMKLLKEFAPQLSTPLTSIFNASLQQAESPLDWKTSYVTPVPKTPSPTSLDQTRHAVSITPLPSLMRAS
ncbi:uncharacterized protein LOC127004456 [Eriocheir sinensis]|uniref:uncharacterized protein LOC127004456 n=1 Tax=Eriocheir sinensis TaxID=95602 RepID=UPI0021C825E8|nr:uncharacterized protein LOC127004456 [Eriocheir sinensis]XP_050728152.1 uncharacterized protein LOC127004456 [Eriocheir sinensis]